MSLEQLALGANTIWNTRFISRTERANRLKGLHADLESYITTDLQAEELYELDSLYVRLQSAPQHELYADTIARVQEIRSTYRDTSGPHIATRLLEAKGHRYEARFDAVNAYLSEGTFMFDDLALAINSLDTNSYVKRRAKTDQLFAKRVEDMRENLVNALMDVKKQEDPQEKQGYFSRLKSGLLKTAAVAATAAMLVPSTVYASFFR